MAAVDKNGNLITGKLFQNPLKSQVGDRKQGFEKKKPGDGFPADSGRPQMGNLIGSGIDSTGSTATARRPDFARFSTCYAGAAP